MNELNSVFILFYFPFRLPRTSSNQQNKDRNLKEQKYLAEPNRQLNLLIFALSSLVLR